MCVSLESCSKSRFCFYGVGWDRTLMYAGVNEWEMRW